MGPSASWACEASRTKCWLSTNSPISPFSICGFGRALGRDRGKRTPKIRINCKGGAHLWSSKPVDGQLAAVKRQFPQNGADPRKSAGLDGVIP